MARQHTVGVRDCGRFGGGGRRGGRPPLWLRLISPRSAPTRPGARGSAERRGTCAGFAGSFGWAPRRGRSPRSDPVVPRHSSNPSGERPSGRLDVLPAPCRSPQAVRAASEPVDRDERIILRNCDDWYQSGKRILSTHLAYPAGSMPRGAGRAERPASARPTSAPRPTPPDRVDQRTPQANPPLSPPSRPGQRLSGSGRPAAKSSGARKPPSRGTSRANPRRPSQPNRRIAGEPFAAGRTAPRSARHTGTAIVRAGTATELSCRRR